MCNKKAGVAEMCGCGGDVFGILEEVISESGLESSALGKMAKTLASATNRADGELHADADSLLAGVLACLAETLGPEDGPLFLHMYEVACNSIDVDPLVSVTVGLTGFAMETLGASYPLAISS
jgi:hypothetical protein